MGDVCQGPIDRCERDRGGVGPDGQPGDEAEEFLAVAAGVGGDAAQIALVEEFLVTPPTAKVVRIGGSK